MELILSGAGYGEVKAFLSDIIKQYRAGRFSLDEIGIPGGSEKALMIMMWTMHR
jgi:DNA polymerase I